MSTSTLAATAPPKTPRSKGDFTARAGQAFELSAAAHGQPPLRATGRRARGAQAIDVPRNLAATPSGPLFATAVVERGQGLGFTLRLAPAGKES